MITKMRNKVLNRRNNHDEGSDLVVTLFMIPFVIALLFSMIDISTYFQTKTQVQNITRDGARQVALYGGTSASIPLNIEKTGGKSVTTTVAEKLYKNGNCVISGCTKPPVVTCGPTIARAINEDAYCTVRYNYSGVGGEIVSYLGFDGIIGTEIVVTETFKVETRW